MSNQGPYDVLRSILAIAAGRDWQREGNLLREELAPYLTEDLFEGPFELAKVPREAGFSHEQWGENMVEVVVSGYGLPDKAVLILTPSGWKLASYWGQCTGCLGSGKVLEEPCQSCAGTGWGIR